MKVVTIANEKGGAGKSTIAINLAVAAAKEGRRVLLIDADTQGSSIAFRAIRSEKFLKDDIKAVQITKPTIHKDIKDFANFDIVFIDAGGRDTDTFRSAIFAASEGMLVVPVLPSVYDIWATEDTIKVLREARTFRDIKGNLLFNKVIPNTTISRDAYDAVVEMAEANDMAVMGAKIGMRVAFQGSVGKGQGVIEADPGSKAADDIMFLYSEVKKAIGLKK